VEFREENRQKFPEFFNGAVPSFGPVEAQLLVVGLAPGMKGANATQRPFTGDYAGELLYPALLRHGLARENTPPTLDADAAPHLTFYQAHSPLHRYNPFALELLDARITNAVRCVPPENKPTGAETKICNQFLTKEMQAMPNLKVILTLGQIAHKATLQALGLKASHCNFGHAALHQIESPHLRSDRTIQLINSYHTSRYNVNTRRLTEAMFDEVMEKIAAML
jgi:uracil-DNA glycosylase family 4